MKAIRQTIMALVIAASCAGCSSLFYDAKTSVLQQIHKGMSKQEVTELLGEPQYRRFDSELEEWEYYKNLSSSGYTTIILTFDGDKVYALDSFSDPRPAAPPVVVTSPDMSVSTSVSSSHSHGRGMRAADFQKLYSDVKSRPFTDDKLKMLREASVNNRLSCGQCATLMSLFPFDDDRMKVLRIFAPNIVDRENYEEILDVLTSLFKKDDAKKLLKVGMYK